MLQSKDKDWLNGLKNKTHIYAVYRREAGLLFYRGGVNNARKNWLWESGMSGYPDWTVEKLLHVLMLKDGPKFRSLEEGKNPWLKFGQVKLMDIFLV